MIIINSTNKYKLIIPNWEKHKDKDYWSLLWLLLIVNLQFIIIIVDGRW